MKMLLKRIFVSRIRSISIFSPVFRRLLMRSHCSCLASSEHCSRRYFRTSVAVDSTIKRKSALHEKKKILKQQLSNREDEKPLLDDVPLIVKLLHKKKTELSEEIVHDTNDSSQLSLEQLRKSLEAIEWDTKAITLSGQIKESNESLEKDEDIEFKEDGFNEDNISELKYLEDIYLDDEAGKVHTAKTKKKRKNPVSGTPDPSIPKSDLPCSGCGAILHCQDPIIPGYLPSEKFTKLTVKEMQGELCQRCFLIQRHNMFLNVKVSAETYPEIMREIKNAHALVLVVVDLFDMQNSIFTNLLKYIGKHRPLFVVGNKVDLIPKDYKGYLERMKKALLDVCESAGLNPTGKNLKHVCLVSAKTGYGIEELVNKLITLWRGHVYVVGSTNVGKSTLFNALLMSDYCKSSARDFIRRATASVWPGTTLNLLKFPIVNPEPWKLFLRTQRLQKDRVKFEEDKRTKKESRRYIDAVLEGPIGQTDFRSARKIEEDERRLEKEYSGQEIISFSADMEGQFSEISGRDQIKPARKSQEYEPEKFKMYWMYDTPGVVNPEQVINLLEPEELTFMLPKSFVQPRCLVIKPGQVLFITGLGRVDYVQGTKSIFLTVHSSNFIPLVVKDKQEADVFYQESFGTKKLGVPLGDYERLLQIPALVGKEFHVTGDGLDIAVADIQLSSLGWVSVSACYGVEVILRAYTPQAQGLFLRTPALLPYYTYFRGKRKGKTPFYHVTKPQL